MIKKQNYEAPKVEGVILFPQEAVLDTMSPIKFFAITMGDPEAPAVENADYLDDQTW